MLALAAWRDSRCSGCGGDLVETTAEENDGTPGNGAYLPLLPIRCHRCTALAQSEETYRKADTPHPHALIHRVELRPPRVATA
jgi:hypothetical protein